MSTGKVPNKSTPLMSDVDHDVRIDMDRIGGTNNTYNAAYNPTDDNPWGGNDKYETKEDPNDKVGRVESHYVNPTDDAPPTFTRRMSSQLSRRMSLDRQASILDQTGVGGMMPAGITNYIPGLGRQKTQALKATYFCNICFTKYPIDEGFTLRTCQHQFCIECMKGFCTNKISNGQVNMKCFFPCEDNNNKACGDEIEEEDIRQLVDDETWQKYEKFKSNLENTLSRQCPYCDNTQVGDKLNSVITCDNAECGKQYCLYHSNAHPMSESCESYDLRTAKENKMNENAIKELGDNVKPCPKCDFRIIKNGGCNHMKCVKCGCSFCWLCMEVIEDVELPNHYKDENSKCKGQQFAGMEGENPPLSVMLIMLLCMLIFCIPGIALGCVFGCICHPCVVLCCGGDDGRSVFETVAICSMVWMMIPAVIILSILIVIWSGIKATYDNIQSVCSCLPTCPASWIDQIHAQQREPHPI
mmetsp:Transcript_27857/g.24645  ORF Transcript_27857/g.24645 Transcript_27857/m.24645 type:complete len:471 (+) Transcript_27857:37-1449(+)